MKYCTDTGVLVTCSIPVHAKKYGRLDMMTQTGSGNNTFYWSTPYWSSTVQRWRTVSPNPEEPDTRTAYVYFMHTWDMRK